MANVCPDGCIIPSQDDCDSLLVNNYYLGGLYADGYFDRAAIDMTDDNYTVGSGDNAAYNGFLVYNPDTYASVFYPLSGRIPTGREITQPGNVGYYWTTTCEANSTPEYVDGSRAPGYPQKIVVYIKVWCIKTDANCIRPIKSK